MRKLLILITLCLPMLAMAQHTRKITGQVFEASSGRPLPGATVFIDPDAPEAKEYNPAGTVTDTEGNFELTLPASIKYVVVSFIGYEALKADVSGKTEFVFRLKEELKQLDEVVVTGYQKIEKRKLTSAITTVKADDIKSIGVASIDQMLEGQVAGLMATPTNGAPGAPAKMRIRSTVSLTGSTDPLWVLDGMILEGNDIPQNFGDKDNIDNLYNTSIAGVNPADIEDITILKDAAATAIYGARAANGVIVVTTKKGRSGKMRVNASASMFATVRPDLSKLNLMDASQKVDFELGWLARPELESESQSGKGEVARILSKYDQLGQFRENGFDAISAESREAIERLRKSGTDWGDEIYRNAINQQYNLSFSGGSERASYYLSTGYYNEQGTTKGTDFERFNITMKTDLNLLENLKLEAALFVTQSKRKSYMTDADAFINPANYSRNVNPYLDIRDENGDFIYDPDMVGLRSGRSLDFNFIEESENTDYSLKNLSLKPMVTLNYKPVSWLNLMTQFGMQIDRTSTEKFADKNTYFVRKYREKSIKGDTYGVPEGGIIQNWNEDMSQYHWKFQGEFSHRFAEKHDADLMAGVELRGDKNTNIHTKGFGFDSNALTTKPLEFPAGSSELNESIYQQYLKKMYENRYVSYYMTASYTYDNRYTVFGSLRYDGSNLFGVAKKYRYLPLWSVSGAWNINRESFMQDLDWLTNLKLRLSYGIQGNIDRNTSPFIIGTWGNTNVLPGVNEPTIEVTSPPNQNLRWEKTKNWNAGIDFGMLKNRLTFSVDAYSRVSEDLIGDRALANENGFTNTAMNWAKVTNTGFEFALFTVNIRTKNFRWTTDFNIAHNKSKVNKIQVADNDLLPSREGYAIGALFAMKTAGVDENGLPMYWKDGQKVSMNDFFQLTPMYPFYPLPVSALSNEDYRNLFTYVGNSEPKFTGGFINRFYYKNFDLTVSTSFILEQTVQEQPFYTPTSVVPGMNYSQRMQEVWSPSNPDGKYPGLLGYGMEGDMLMAAMWFDDDRGSTAFRYSDFWFKKMSYLRVNSIRLGYTLPEKIAQKLHLANARISAETRNPFVFGSSYKGYFDPETYGNIYSQPLPKTFSVGLDLTF